jgi:hypothetical protein
MFVGLMQTADDPVAAFFTHSNNEEPVRSYTGSQHLTGIGLGQSGWIEAQTKLSLDGIFSYKILSEGGSSQIREKALKPFLEAERNQKKPEDSAFSGNNYDITLEGMDGGGLILLKLQPRRKATNLIDGFLFIHQDGDLVRVEGEPAKSPSIWIFGSKIFRYYNHLAGVRVPTKMVSTATFFFRPSSLTVEYNYTEINGRKVNQ